MLRHHKKHKKTNLTTGGNVSIPDKKLFEYSFQTFYKPFKQERNETGKLYDQHYHIGIRV